MCVVCAERSLSLLSMCALVLLCCLLSLPLLCPGFAHAAIVINEVLYDPEGADTGLEFVELLNCGSADVLLTGWVLETGNGAGPGDWTVEWIGGDFDVLAAGAIFLVGERDVVPAPDVVTPLDLQNGPDGVRLTDGTSVIDVVGWGGPLFPEYFEGVPAEDVPSGSSLARFPDCFDTDDNARDLVAAPAPTPGHRNAEGTDLAVSLAHRVGEVQPEGPVSVVCSVVNAGALPVAGGSAFARLHVDGILLPVDSQLIENELAVRETMTFELTCPVPARGYHTAMVSILLAADTDTTNNTARTTFTVVRPGGQVAVNEIMHSPGEQETEWLELVGVGSSPVCIDGWRIGDENDSGVLDAAEAFELAAGLFLVLAREPEIVEPRTTSPVVAVDDWEALSATDVVVLSDRYGTPIDIVRYERSWGAGRDISLERVRPEL
ncbi:lamin tail domain-containing protein, partial [bacterium]|nr:lamin tail domain-containing protein [bacterium]